MDTATLRSFSTGDYLKMGGDPLTHDRALLQAQAVFLHNLGKMLAVGVPVLGALRHLARDTRHPALREAVVSITQGIATGGTLSDSMNLPVFSGTTLMMISLGEKTGRLDVLLLAAAECLEKQAAIA